MPRTIYYKAVKKSPNGELISLYPLGDYICEYKHNKYVYPKIGRLFVSKTLEYCLELICKTNVDLSNPIEIWECEVQDPRKIMYCARTRSRMSTSSEGSPHDYNKKVIKAFWKSKAHEAIVFPGTYGCLAVKLMKRIRTLKRADITIMKSRWIEQIGYSSRT